MNKYVQKLNHVNKISILKTKYRQNQQQNQTKQSLVHKSPVESPFCRTCRRRGDRPPSNVCGYNSGKCEETRNSLSLSGEKKE